MNGKCDREIKCKGYDARVWRACGRKATVVSERRQSGTFYDLEYCARHEKHAYQTDSPNLITVLRVKQLVPMFHWSDYKQSASRRSNQWASTDRGWCHLAWKYHPQMIADTSQSLRDYLKSTLDRDGKGPAIGNYLDYSQCPAYAGKPNMVFATANMPVVSLAGISQHDLGHKYCASVGEAKAWIEATISDYLARQAVPA